MNASTLALLGYIGWFILLLLMIAVLRSGLTLAGKRKANDFRVDGSDVSPFSERLARAHANCYESFPIFGGLLLLAIASNKTGLTDGTALFWLGARLAQSIVHLISTSPMAVTVRFGFFFIQVSIACWWLLKLTGLL